MKEKRGFLLFITSCMAGCGQMYQGYMKRGLSLLLMFFSLTALSAFLALAPLAFFLPVVWLYAFFDSYALRSRIAEGQPPEDEFLFGLSEMDNQRMGQLLRRRHSFIGWALVLSGLYIFYGRLIRGILGSLQLSWLYDLMVYDLPQMAVSLLIVGLGVWFIRGPRGGRDDADIPPFTPPQQTDCANDCCDGKAQEPTENEEVHSDETAQL